MRIAAVVLLSAFIADNASAQLFETDKLTGNTVFMAIQCDIGRFSVPAAKAGIDQKMKASVMYSWEVEKSAKLAASVGITIIDRILEGPKVEASATWTKTDGNKLEGDFNINEGNTQACGARVRPRVPVGVYDCLVGNTMPLKGGKGATCDKTRIAAGKFIAKGKIRWLIFEAGPQGDFDIKVTYKISIIAPAKEKKETPKSATASTELNRVSTLPFAP